MPSRPVSIPCNAGEIFYELTRSTSPACCKAIDARILFRDVRFIMRKRCPEHGRTEALISSDADMYVRALKYHKPGTMPLQFSTEVKDGCPTDCGLCPEHKQYTCLALIEVNSHCHPDCSICFAAADTLGGMETNLNPLVLAPGGSGSVDIIVKAVPASLSGIGAFCLQRDVQ